VSVQSNGRKLKIEVQVPRRGWVARKFPKRGRERGTGNGGCGLLCCSVLCAWGPVQDVLGEPISGQGLSYRGLWSPIVHDGGHCWASWEEGRHFAVDPRR